jgi:hypothetical protein
MPIGGHRRVHVVPFGVERDRIVRPVVEYDADRVVLLDYFTHPVPARPALEAVVEPLEAADIAWTRRELEVGDIFDAMAAVGALIADHGDDEVYVNLATGSKPVTIGAMLACMTTDARPYYVTAERHGSHQGPIPAGIESVRAVPSYPMERPSDQQLRVMAHIADSDRTTVDGTPYRIKSELIDFGDRAELPFLADYAGETEKGKYRRLDAHIVSPLTESGFVRVEKVGTQRRVFLTEDGRNTLRAFRYVLQSATVED